MMNVSRRNATATLLNDGRVLIAGGLAFGHPVATAEIYDPDSGAFTLTGSMTEPRAYHVATVIANGRVLITGGSADGSAEIYNPATGKFARTGMMRDKAAYQIAIRLNDGRVLVAGGRIGDNYSAMAEYYTPSTGKFNRARTMKDNMENAQATLLADGKVLIAGGDRGAFGPKAAILAAAEIFNPARGTFTKINSMLYPRSHFTATMLLTGKVLVVGGVTTVSSTGLLATAELYNPATGKWSATGSMAVGRSDFSATLLVDGRVLIAGGGDNSAELYDPATGTFRLAPHMVMVRESQTATRLEDTRVLLAGGNDATLAELYSP
jgi:N-acetylneuraminic acid mutarotase